MRIGKANFSTLIVALIMASMPTGATSAPSSFVGSASYNTNASGYILVRAKFYQKKRTEFLNNKENTWNVADFVEFINRPIEPLSGRFRVNFSEANEFIIILQCNGSFDDENIIPFTNISAQQYSPRYLYCRD